MGVKKNHTVFILCHIVVLTVIVAIAIVFEGKNEGAVSRGSPAHVCD